MKIIPFNKPLRGDFLCKICRLTKDNGRGYWICADGNPNPRSTAQAMLICDECMEDEEEVKCLYSVRYLL